MTAIYDATIFLNIALLAIAVSVFVLAASLLGRALEMSRKDEEDRLARESQETDRTLSSLRAQSEETGKGNEAISRIKEEVKKYEAEKRSREKASSRSRRAFGLLSVRESVVYPGFLFLLSLVFSGSAVIVSPRWGSTVLWLVALAVAGFGVCRLNECLGVIQKVAITSEEGQHRRLIVAFREALKAHEEAGKPKVYLTWKGKTPPFTFAVDAQEAFVFTVFLLQGDIARNTLVSLLAPEGFEFPGAESLKQDQDFAPLPGALTAEVVLGDIRKGTRLDGSINLKMPSKAGQYTLLYRLFCDGFTGEYDKFVVEVA